MSNVSTIRNNQKLVEIKSVSKAVNDGKPKLLDRLLREALCSRHNSRRTEQTYCLWVKRHIHFHHLRHPKEMAEKEVSAFLTHLAIKEKASSSTQNQALAALLLTKKTRRQRRRATFDGGQPLLRICLCRLMSMAMPVDFLCFNKSHLLYRWSFTSLSGVAGP